MKEKTKSNKKNKMNKKGLVWGQILAMLIALVMIGILLFFANKYMIQPAKSLSSCEAHGGVCQEAPCHSIEQWPMTYTCKDKNQYCCMYKEGYKEEKTIENIIAKGSSGIIQKEGNNIYVYAIDNPNDPEAVRTISAEDETIPLSDETLTYYFTAQGKDIGVCYASIITWEEEKGKHEVWKNKGQEMRIRLDSKQCQKFNENKLSFNIKDLENGRTYSIQFIVFPKKWGETVSEFRSKATKKGYWQKSNEWVGMFVKNIKLGEPNCDSINGLYTDPGKRKTACISNTNNCVWCPLTRKCLDTHPFNSQAILQGESVCTAYCEQGVVRYDDYNSNDKECVPGLDYCKDKLQVKFDYSSNNQIIVKCSPKECCGKELKYAFSDIPLNQNSNYFNCVQDFTEEGNEKKAVISSYSSGCSVSVGKYLGVLIQNHAGKELKQTFSQIPTNSNFYKRDYRGASA